MSEITFCDGCRWLSPTEEQQEMEFYKSGSKLNHECNLHDQRVYHYEHHPRIVRVTNCTSYELAANV